MSSKLSKPAAKAQAKAKAKARKCVCHTPYTTKLCHCHFLPYLVPRCWRSLPLSVCVTRIRGVRCVRALARCGSWIHHRPHPPLLTNHAYLLDESRIPARLSRTCHRVLVFVCLLQIQLQQPIYAAQGRSTELGQERIGRNDGRCCAGSRGESLGDPLQQSPSFPSSLLPSFLQLIGWMLSRCVGPSTNRLSTACLPQSCCFWRCLCL